LQFSADYLLVLFKGDTDNIPAKTMPIFFHVFGRQQICLVGQSVLIGAPFHLLVSGLLFDNSGCEFQLLPVYLLRAVLSVVFFSSVAFSVNSFESVFNSRVLDSMSLFLSPEVVANCSFRDSRFSSMNAT